MIYRWRKNSVEAADQKSWRLYQFDFMGLRNTSEIVQTSAGKNDTNDIKFFFGKQIISKWMFQVCFLLSAIWFQCVLMFVFKHLRWDFKTVDLIYIFYNFASYFTSFTNLRRNANSPWLFAIYSKLLCDSHSLAYYWLIQPFLHWDICFH